MTELAEHMELISSFGPLFLGYPFCHLPQTPLPPQFTEFQHWCGGQFRASLPVSHVPLYTAFPQAGESNLAICRCNPEMWGILCLQYNPHLMEDECLWINVSTSLSSRRTVLSSDHLSNTYFVFLPFLSLSLYFVTLLFSVITSKIKSLSQVLVSGSALSGRRKCGRIQSKTS